MNEIMKLERNPDYWKPGLPYLDAIEYRIVPNRATRMLGFVAGKFDMSVPDGRDGAAAAATSRSRHRRRICNLRRTNVGTNLIINRDAPPFDNPDIRKALALTLDRKAFNDILNEGQGRIGARHAAAARGRMGHARRTCWQTLPGYGPDVARNGAKRPAHHAQAATARTIG